MEPIEGTAYCPIENSVLPDANIWFSTTLHAWFGLLAAELDGSWTFHWTEDILAEATYRKRRAYPDASSHQIEAVRDRLMAVSSNHRISGYPIDESVTYSDKNDAHVHSAAVYGRIQIIVTNDKKGFVGLYPSPDDYPYEIYTADEFLMLMFETVPTAVRHVLRQQHAYYCERKKSFNLATKLIDAQCPKFADVIRIELQHL